MAPGRGNPTSFTYQWQDCDSAGNGCTAISGATGPTYTLTTGDVGHSLRVVETASNSGGAGAPASSAPTGVLAPTPPAPVAPVNTSLPVVSGTTHVGQTLTSSTGVWSGTAPLVYTYQWQRCTPACSDISGATASTYTLASPDGGAGIRVEVSATNVAGAAQAPSVQVGPVSPTTAQIKAALRKLLSPSGKSAKLAQVLKHGYTFSFTAAEAGRLTLSWYQVPKGASVARKAKPSLLLVATASLGFNGSRPAKLKLKLPAVVAGWSSLRQAQADLVGELRSVGSGHEDHRHPKITLRR